MTIIKASFDDNPTVTAHHAKYVKSSDEVFFLQNLVSVVVVILERDFKHRHSKLVSIVMCCGVPLILQICDQIC